jgi:hypothetical protein
LVALVFAVAVAATAVAAQSLPPPSTGTSIAVTASRVPLNLLNPSQSSIGPFTYAGGLVLTSSQSRQLHGLSDLDVDRDGRVTAVGDEGVLMTARLVLDARGRLMSLRQVRVAPLTGEDGKPLGAKERSDAEGLAVFPNGDRLVAFERQHRILMYPSNGGLPRLVPHPDVTFTESNAGMEALAPDPARGADAYIVGIEATGETFNCRMTTRCGKAFATNPPADTNLVALRRLAADRTAYLFRGLVNGVPRIVLRVVRGNNVEAQLELTPPLIVDNFEGVAAVPRPGGAIRFYLLSDDNESDQQRTLLIAFDWRPR